MTTVTCPDCGNGFVLSGKTQLHIGNINKLLFDKINKTVPFASIRTFYVCSPFLSQLNYGQITLKKIGRQKRLVVITRPKNSPSDYDRHKNQFEFLQKECKADMNTIDNLHAKMYIMEAGSASFAMTGSMNLTNPKSIEAAIFTTDSKLFDDHKNNFLYELKSKSKPVK